MNNIINMNNNILINNLPNNLNNNDFDNNNLNNNDFHNNNLPLDNVSRLYSIYNEILLYYFQDNWHELVFCNPNIFCHYLRYEYQLQINDIHFIFDIVKNSLISKINENFNPQIHINFHNYIQLINKYNNAYKKYNEFII